MRLATMPAGKTLEQFDWSHAGGAPKAQILELAHLAFVPRAGNVVLLGRARSARPMSPWHLAIGGDGRAQGALRHHRRPDAAAGRGHGAGAPEEYFNRAVLGPKLLIVDKIGYLPFGREEATLFFKEPVEQGSRHRLVVCEGARPLRERQVARQHHACALVALGHAHIVQISGESYRLKDKRKAGQAAKRAASVQ